jgi:hypothetical protein
MTASREIVFIDETVSHLKTLLAGLRPDVEPIVLTASTRATAQIATALEGRDGLRAVHVVAHGGAGELLFGAGALSLETLDDEATELAAIGRALGGDGGLLLWSCNTGEGERGSAFVNELAQLISANVAAASGRVGAEARGGRWELDVRANAVDARAPLTAEGMAAYPGVMTGGVTINPIAGNDIINSAEAGAGVTVGGTWSGAGSGNHTLTIKILDDDGNTVQTYTSSVNGNSGNWSFPLPSSHLTALANDEYFLSVNVSDDGQGDKYREFDVDRTAPTTAVDITAIANDSGTAGDFVTNDTTLTVSGTHGPLAAGEKVQVSSNGGATWSDVTTSTATTWSFTDPTAHGSNFTYQARVVDTAGNVGNTDSQAVAIDTLNPTLTVNIVDSSLNDGDNVSDVTFEFSENVTGFAAGRRCVFWRDAVELHPG